MAVGQAINGGDNVGRVLAVPDGMHPRVVGRYGQSPFELGLSHGLHDYERCLMFYESVSQCNSDELDRQSNKFS